jgi:hypothetical protein
MSTTQVAERRVSWPIRGLLTSAVLIAAGYGAAFGGPAWGDIGALLLAAGNALIVPSAMALGAPLKGRFGGVLSAALAGTGLVIVAAIGTALLLGPSESADSTLLLGLPRRAAIVLLGVGVIPMLLLPALFAATFDEGPFEAGRIANLKRLRAAASPADGDAS